MLLLRPQHRRCRMKWKISIRRSEKCEGRGNDNFRRSDCADACMFIVAETLPWRSCAPSNSLWDQNICFVVHCIIPNEPVMTNMLPLLTKMRISFSCLTEVLVECMDRVCMAGFAQSFKIFESLGKIGYAFQGLESLWKLSGVCESVWILWSSVLGKKIPAYQSETALPKTKQYFF